MSLNVPLIDAENLFRAIKSFRHDVNDLPDTNEFPVYRTWLDMALGAFWRSEWWPQLMLGEWRYFRANWASGTTYNKTDEVYDAATQQYFQCLRDSVSGAGNSPTDSNGDERSAYWAACAPSYSGPNWASGTAYEVGDIIFYPVDNNLYQCHTAHTSSGTLIPTATGGNERWGVLTPFDRYIAFDQTWETNEIGDVFDVKNDNPKVNSRWRSVPWEVSEQGVQVLADYKRVFVQFRRPRPRIKGARFDATLTYAAGDQVYFDNDETQLGNFYNCVTATTAGQDPADTPAKWAVVEIPEFFQQHLILECSAKGVLNDDRSDMGAVLAAMAEFAAGLETDVLYRQQGQAPPASVRTYASRFR